MLSLVQLFLGKSVLFVAVAIAVAGCGSGSTADDAGLNSDTPSTTAFADGPTRLDVRKPDSAPDLSVAPVCPGADSTGFFSACSFCSNPGNCDSVTVGGQTLWACSCKSDGDCPCGLTCGCATIAPSVLLCEICRR